MTVRLRLAWFSETGASFRWRVDDEAEVVSSPLIIEHVEHDPDGRIIRYRGRWGVID